MGTRGSVFWSGAFSLRNKNPVFLQIFLIAETQREERKLLPGRRRKRVFLNTRFSARCSLQRLRAAGTNPGVLCRKDGAKAAVVRSRILARLCCPEQHLQLHQSQKMRFGPWEKAHNLCQPSLQHASHFLIAFLQRLLLSNAYFVEKLHHKQPTGKEINNC